jgi:hypothetical protein
MNPHQRNFALAACIGATMLSTACASTINWTNVAGGNWSLAANWSPNQVPGSADDATVTNAGTYTVTLDTSPTVGSLTLGGSSGQQTLATAGSTLGFNSASTVKRPAELDRRPNQLRLRGDGGRQWIAGVGGGQRVRLQHVRCDYQLGNGAIGRR